MQKKLWIQSVLGADRCKEVAAEHGVGTPETLAILEAEAKEKSSGKQH
jgi:hypothetical protein